MARSSPFEITCVICKKPVDLKTSKTDERGNPVHERCSARKEALVRATQAISQRHAS
jgi:hypothetical protein